MRSVIGLKNGSFVSTQETVESVQQRKLIAEQDRMTHILVRVRKSNGQLGVRSVLVANIKSITVL